MVESGKKGAAYNMALDEAIARCVIEDVKEGNAPAPVLRFFGWDAPSVTLGGFQRMADVDAGFCKQNNIPIVRRPTGGRAILHADEFTYSFTAPLAGAFSGGLFDSYDLIGRAFALAFKALGLEVEMHQSRRARGGADTRTALCFSSTSYAEVTVGGKKIIGSAQKRWPGAMLQQGSIPYALDRELMQSVFTSGDPWAISGLREFDPDITDGAFKKSVVAGFEGSFGITLELSEPTEREHAMALELVEQKYSTDGWTRRR